MLTTEKSYLKHITNRPNKGTEKMQAIAVENHPNDSRVKLSTDGKVQTLSNRMGTGGGNVPLVMIEVREVSEMNNSNEYVVRRLTPLECERLQGFPDGWTDIPGASDTARYKALGNSIALPQWQIIIDNMAKYLPDGATLGSLFDGIGGFPLCWERTHGKGTAIWASEIEKFPIAVTKFWFP